MYVQLSLDGDATRGGVDRTAPGALDRLCDEIARAQSLELVGLMGIPPLDWDADQAFEQLKSEHDRVLGPTRMRLGCPRACPATWKLPSNMVRRVCVSVPRYWARGRYRHRE